MSTSAHSPAESVTSTAAAVREGGQVTDRLLDTIGVEHDLLDPARLDEQVAAASARLDETRRPVALIVRKGILE